jgi:hypothetical protein
MSSVKLTKELRSTIVEQIVKTKIDPIETAWNTKRAELSERLYRCFVSEQHEQMARAIGTKLVSFAERIVVDDPNGHYLTLRFEKDRPSPQYGPFRPNLLTDQAMQAKSLKLIAEVRAGDESVAKQRLELRTQLLNTLNAFTTVKSLREAMPEIDPLLPDYVKAPPVVSGVLVPVEQIEKTRALLKSIAPAEAVAA